MEKYLASAALALVLAAHAAPAETLRYATAGDIYGLDSPAPVKDEFAAWIAYGLTVQPMSLLPVVVPMLVATASPRSFPFRRLYAFAIDRGRCRLRR